MKLSIIVPIHNEEGHILRCLRSLARQTVQRSSETEVIMVDDGSTDGSAERVRLFLAENEEANFRFLSQEHEGASAARRQGMQEASGEWIGFVDADDQVEPEYYEELLGAADLKNVDLIGSGYTTHDEKGRVRVYPASQKQQGDVITLDWRSARRQVMDRSGVYQFLCNKIFRRDLLRQVDFPGEQFVGEDFEVLWHYLPLCRQVGIVDSAGYHYFFHGENTTRQNFGEERRLGFFRYQRLYQAFCKDPKSTPEERSALARYLVLEYMSFLLSMYRGGEYDPAVEKEIIDFVQEHRGDYLRSGGDGVAAKAFAMLLMPASARLYRRLWPRR